MSVGTWIWTAQGVASALTLVARRPWTMALSARRYDASIRPLPVFRRVNLLVTAGWTLYFALAAVSTALTTGWVGLALAAPTPLLGWCSFTLGDRYARHLMRPRLDHEGARAMPTPDQIALRSLIEGKTDEEIVTLAAASAGGVDALLDATVAGMADALDPVHAVDCVVGYEIDDGAHPVGYRVEVRGHDVTVQKCAPSDARVVLQLNVPEYLRLITGLLDGTEAFLSGRMKIRGDVMFAPQIGRMFASA